MLDWVGPTEDIVTEFSNQVEVLMIDGHGCSIVLAELRHSIYELFQTADFVFAFVSSEKMNLEQFEDFLYGRVVRDTFVEIADSFLRAEVTQVE